MPTNQPKPIELATDAATAGEPTAAESVTANEAGGSRPVTRFSGSGGLSVAVWKHKSEDGPDRYSIRLDRSYSDADGEFHNTDYLRDTDLLRAQKLLDDADAWIEQDKARGRAASREVHSER